LNPATGAIFTVGFYNCGNLQWGGNNAEGLFEFMGSFDSGYLGGTSTGASGSRSCACAFASRNVRS
jgi:hypothetical protein